MYTALCVVVSLAIVTPILAALTLLAHQWLARMDSVEIAGEAQLVDKPALAHRLKQVTARAAAWGVLGICALLVTRSTGPTEAMLVSVAIIELALCFVLGGQLHLRGIYNAPNLEAENWLALQELRDRRAAQAAKVEPYFKGPGPKLVA